MAHTLYLSLGSNLGNREEILRHAIELIGKRIGHVKQVSSWIETEPEGFVSEYRFLNLALELETELSPLEVLDTTQQIERELGRKHKSTSGVYTDRPIDIDLLIYDELNIDTERLVIPHIYMHQRAFVLIPLREIAPDLIHVRLGKSIRELCSALGI